MRHFAFCAPPSLVVLTVGCFLLSRGGLSVSASASEKSTIDVMTQNLYLGFDLARLASPTDLEGFIQVVEDSLAIATANNFYDRAGAIAKNIEERSPNVVALQEVYNYQVNGENAVVPFVDYLEVLLEALGDLGVPYVPVSQVQNSVYSIQTQDGILLEVTDRDVLLVREDIAESADPIPFNLFCARPSLDGGPGCNFQTFFLQDNPDPLPDIFVERGWCGIDIEVEGKMYRIVNTHLEIDEFPGDSNGVLSIFQTLQAAELIEVLDATPNLNGASVLLVGDLNSPPESEVIPTPQPPLFPYPPPFDQFIIPPYQLFLLAGYSDVWTLKESGGRGKKGKGKKGGDNQKGEGKGGKRRRLKDSKKEKGSKGGKKGGRGNEEGFTCCQDEDLSNEQSNLSRRIDFIFTKDLPRKVKYVEVLGDQRSDKTEVSNLWPSDHGAVAAGLQF